MKEIHKTYKFEIYPTNTQKEELEKHFGCVRWVYNHFLNERKEQYQANKKSDNYYKQAKTLTQLKKQEEYKWLNEASCQALQFSLRCLDTAYLNFFRGNTKYPKFKSKKGKNSFTVPDSRKFRITETGRLVIPKFREGFKFKEKREIKGELRKCTISKSPTGRYYASICVIESHTPHKKTGKSVGVDLGIKDLAVTSEGKKYKNHRYTKKYEKDLRVAQKHLSRKKKGSNSFERQRRKVAKIHEKISNCRKDTLHKISCNLVKEYDIICVEDLNVKGMMANHKLAKHISDVSWGTFIQMLEYKSEWNDKKLVKIGRFYPSSKTCNECGWINQGLRLSDRIWTCVNGHKLDRDINAAKNILKEGINFIGTESLDYTDGGDVRGVITQSPVKSEVLL